MDIEKNLVSTYDQDFIFREQFLYEGIYADVYLYESHFAFSSQLQSTVIHFDEDTSFEICLNE